MIDLESIIERFNSTPPRPEVSDSGATCVTHNRNKEVLPLARRRGCDEEERLAASRAGRERDSRVQ